MSNSYDLLVLGGGAAGLVSSSFAAGLGLRVGLVSDGPPGGECLWTGCVPTKALIHRALISQTLKEEGHKISEQDFCNAMHFMKKTRDKISHHDSIETVEKSGVKVITGRAKFLTGNSVQVGNESLFAKKFVIAVGGHQAILPVEGLADCNPLTHETILELEHRPQHLLIVGGGPVGVEYAQTMLRLGIKVTLVEGNGTLLRKEEPEASGFVLNLLENEGCSVLLGQSMSSAVKNGANIDVCLTGKNGSSKVTCDQILLATGKTPNTKDLELDKAGVSVTEKGWIKVNRHQKTSANNIWACGDITGDFQFTHYADHAARIAILNACLRLPVKSETSIIPWCTFTNPEIARVGLTEAESRKRYGDKSVFVLFYDLSNFDRAILDGANYGFIKTIVNKEGKILGTTIVGERAGELIHEFALAMKNKLSIKDLSALIHVYPTMSGAIRNLSNLYYREVMSDTWQSKVVKAWARISNHI
jgi:pyruvate/2-oxoglutarate dehydrogenase complex dihydrolipoamide dehydrogenase (E3) component